MLLTTLLTLLILILSSYIYFVNDFISIYCFIHKYMILYIVIISRREKGVQMNKYDYILWDWNGTIVDDLDTNFKIINQLLLKRNLPAITMQKYKEIFTFPIIDFYRSAGFDCQTDAYDALVSDYKSTYEAQMNNINLMPYAEFVFSKINHKKIKQFIFSASSYHAIKNQLNFFNISHYFSDIIAQTNDYAFGKYDLAVQWYNRNSINNANRILVIGDTLHDFEISQKMGFDCLLISKGHQDLQLYRSKYSCKCLSDILEVLENLQ